MLKQLLTTLTVLTAAALHAQPVINYPGLNNVIGTSLEAQLVTNPPASLANGGTNVVWDLTGSNFTTAGTVDIVDPSTTPYGSQFPAANLGIVTTIMGQSIYEYAIAAPQGLITLAEDINGSSPDIYIDTKKTLEFPMNIGDSYTDTYNVSGGPIETTFRQYDAYGSLIVHGGTFTNVVRVTRDVTDATWYNLNPFYPILDYNGTDVIFFDIVTIAGVNHPKATTGFNLYPNPASGFITISMNHTTEATAQITDMTGHIIDTFELHNTFRYNTGALQSGVYFCRISTSDGSTVNKFIIN